MTGLGLLHRRLLPGSVGLGLVLPLGFSTLVLVGEFSVLLGLPAAVAIAVLIAGALLGYVGLVRIDGGMARLRRPSRETLWGVAALTVVAAIYVVSVAGTGQATLAGYNLVGDPVIHLTGADALLGGEGGRARQPGAFQAFFDGYYGNGYPTGGASVLAITDALAGVDPAQVLHPLLVFAMVVFGSAVWVLVRPVTPSPWVRAVVVVLASVPALTFSFVMMSSLKEIFAVAVIASTAAACTLLWPTGGAPTAASAGAGLRRTRATTWRTAVPLAVGPGAVIASIGPAGAVYVIPVFIVVVAALWVGRGVRVAIGLAAVVAVLVAALAVPSLVGLGGYLDVSGTVLTTQRELGNLDRGPLVWREVLGIWLGTDFRTTPALPDVTKAADLVVLGLVALGIGWAVVRLARRRLTAAVVPLLAWLAAMAVATVVVLGVGSPWADAKALAIAAPAVMVAAGVGLAALWATRRMRPLASVAGGLLVAAVGGSVALAAYGVGAAPQARFAELRQIDDRFAGQGPILASEWEEFTRHALRRVPGRFAGDPYFPVASNGAFGFSRDGDDVDAAQVQAARLLLVRMGPAASRPPSNFALAWRGRFYEVWRRDPARPVPRVHQGIGAFEVGGLASPTCAEIEAVAAQARPGERLVVARRAAPPSTATMSSLPLPAGWRVDAADPRAVVPQGPGTVTVDLPAPAPGAEVDVWLEGSFSRRVVVRAGGRRGTIGPSELNPRWSATRVMTVRADGNAAVRIVVERPGGALRPGWGDRAALWGAISITPHEPLAATRVERLRPAEARRLCGQTLDWLELTPAD